MPGGRPTDYNEAIAKEICDIVATTPKGLKKLCAENPHWPAYSTIWLWKRTHPQFSNLYMQAKADQVEPLIDEILDISDDSENDTITRTTKSGEEYEACNTEWLNRSRLRIDTRKWIACKLAPKIYGDKQQNEHGVSESVMQNIIDKL